MTSTPDPTFGVFSLLPDPAMSGRRAAVDDLAAGTNYTAAAAQEKADHYRHPMGANVDVEEWDARAKFWQTYADTIRAERDTE